MSEWRVSSNYAGGSHFWQVYRLRSMCAVDHAGNREYRGGLFDTEAEAQRYADELNRERVAIEGYEGGSGYTRDLTKGELNKAVGYSV